MKVTLERNQLLKSLGHVHRVVERRNTYPILANVLLKADRRQARSARHRSRHRSHRVRARDGRARPGTTTVPAHTLYEIVRKLADGAEVRLETDGAEQMLLTSGPLALPSGLPVARQLPRSQIGHLHPPVLDAGRDACAS